MLAEMKILKKLLLLSILIFGSVSIGSAEEKKLKLDSHELNFFSGIPIKQLSLVQFKVFA